MNILIVEDDLVIRDGIGKLIQMHFPKITLFFAENGHMALQMLRMSPRMNIVFTDIKMPVLNGIELIKIIKEERFPCDVIVLSGYDDFDLVRTALKNGALDYLLKPLNMKKLTDILAEIYKKWESTSIHNPSLPLESYSAAKQMSFFQSVIAIKSMAQLDTLKELAEDQQYSLVMIEPKSFLNLLQQQENIQKLAQWLQQNSIDSYLILLYQDFIGILCPANAHWQNIMPSVPTIIDPQKYWFSFGKSTFPKGVVSTVFLACMEEIDQSFFNCNLQSVDTSETSLDTLQKQCTESILNLNKNELYAVSEKLFGLLQQKHYTKKEIRNILSHFVYALLEKDKRLIKIIATYKLTDFDITEHIKCAQSFYHLVTGFKEIIALYMHELEKSALHTEQFYITKARQYIEANYMHDITLNDVASTANLHPNYFSTVFRNATGITFREFLRNVRIEKAKSFMGDPKKRIYDIAFDVGYKEASQFNKAFKEVTGMAPNQYRKKNL